MNKMDTPNQKPIPDHLKSRIDELIEQPCTKPCYGGIIVHEL